MSFQFLLIYLYTKKKEKRFIKEHPELTLGVLFLIFFQLFTGDIL
ncbi:hypothetical protein SC09_contig4orf00861 [Bacillus subtilis]|uniref:Uncharacterized protein n=1 Tax=Bacillus subtilis TaxID=1423 RepID=A0A0D1KC14_BACIU|nr:hypothetical protein SC09_contig4orf00861 [Bacillus subtilis]